MEATPFELSRREILIVVAGLMVGLSLSALDGTIVATALPTIVGDLGGLEHLSWIVTSYLLASTAATHGRSALMSESIRRVAPV